MVWWAARTAVVTGYGAWWRRAEGGAAACRCATAGSVGVATHRMASEPGGERVMET